MIDVSPAEYKALRLRAVGLTAAEAADRLGVSEQTVKNQSASVYQKLGVDNLASALVLLGWLRIPGDTRQCDFIGRCGRPIGHRGHHGGFRAREVA